jgi:hydrogenase maturation protein HypF
MPGGTAAVREPWRNLYAHLIAAGLPPDRPHTVLDAMIRNGVNSPSASSCGRLFDAMAAALGICHDRQHYEGEAAARLEALVCDHTLREEDDALAYPFVLSEGSLASIDPTSMWRALRDDLSRRTTPGVIAARFHKGLAMVVATTARALAERFRFDTVALSGGCFQNAVLFEQTEHRLRAAGFTVLTHSMVPANDGGLALGQAAIAAARLIA